MFQNFFSGIGIDVSNHHVRLARVSVFNKIHGLKEIILPVGLVEDEKVAQPNEIKKIIEQAMNEWNLPKDSFRTTVLVPESRVFFTNVVLDKKMSNASAFEAAKNLAQKDIPIPFNQVSLVTSKGEVSDNDQLINVYTCQKEIIEGLKNAVNLPFFKPVAMETNSKALLRLFNQFAPSAGKSKIQKDLIGVVDIGHDWTTVSVYTSFGSLLFSRSLSYGDSVKENQGIPILPLKTVELIVETIKEVKEFFLGQNKKIAMFLLCGVEAIQKDVLNACEQEEKSFLTVSVGKLVQIPSLTEADIHCFGSAIGAACRSLSPGKYSYQHNFLNCSDSSSDLDA
jgi:hypothetical protein